MFDLGANNPVPVNILIILIIPLVTCKLCERKQMEAEGSVVWLILLHYVVNTYPLGCTVV